MRKIARASLILLICGLGAWIVQAVWSDGIAERQSLALWDQVQTAPAGMVDFARVVPSDWERVYFFHPYTEAEDIHRALGFRWTEAYRTSISSNDRVNLVVFVQAGRVVGWFEHPRKRGDFLDLATEAGFPRDQARFRVVRYQGGRAALVVP